MDMRSAKARRDSFVRAMRDAGTNERTVVDAEWLVGHLLDRMEQAGVYEVDAVQIYVAALHFMGTDITERAETKTQATIKSALANYWSYCVNGKLVFKTTIYPTGAPTRFKGAFMGFCDYVASLAKSDKSAQCDKCNMLAFLRYLDGAGIEDLGDVEVEHAREFIRDLVARRPGSGPGDSCKYRIVFDWMKAAGLTSFDSADAFPYGFGRNIGGKSIPSHYSEEELSRVFAAVDRGTDVGKRDYLVLCLASLYGMRIGDIVDLRLSDIDWESGRIAKAQSKTGRVICLPLVDQVREAIADYVESARPDTDDDHLLIRTVAPHVGYTGASAFCRMVTGYMNKACIDIRGRHHGCHALRHSAAGGMLMNGVRIEQISDVLGHASALSTQVYLSFDQKVMSKIALEVPHVSR